MWTVSDAIDWYDNYVRPEKADTAELLYQGSDANYRFFAARVAAP